MSLDVFPSNVRGLTYPVEKTSEFNTIAQSAPNLLETTVAQTRNPVWEWKLIYEYLFDDPKNLLSGGYTDYRTLQGFILKQGGRATEFLYSDPTDNAVGPALIAGAPNPLAQLQLLNDGVGNYYSPLQRNFGGLFLEDITDLNGSIAVYENGSLATAGTAVGDWQVQGPGLALPGASFMGLYLQWNSPLAWNHLVYPTNSIILDPAGHLQKATTGGTSGTTIPVFNDSGGTTTDGGVTWTDQGYNPGPPAPITWQGNFYFRVKFGEDKADFTQFMNQLWTYGGSESSGGSQLTLRSSRPVQL